MFEIKVIAKRDGTKLQQEHVLYDEDIALNRSDSKLAALVEQIKLDFKGSDPDIQVRIHFEW